MSTATIDQDRMTSPVSRLTLPLLAVKLGLSLDLVRRRFRENPELIALTERVGVLRFVQTADVDRIRALLAK